MKSLSSKMTLTESVVVAALLCLIITISHAFWFSELKKSIGDNQEAMVSVLTSQLDAQLTTALDQLKKISQLINSGSVADVKQLDRFLSGEEKTLVFFNAGMEILAPDGRMITEFPRSLKGSGRDFSNRDYFKKAATGLKPFIGSMYRNHIDRQPTIPFVVPLLAGDGKLRAVLVGRHEIPKSTLFSTLASARIGKSGYFYIIDADRTIVFHPDSSRIMEHIRPRINLAIEAALSGFEGTRENVNSRGVRGLVSFKRLNAANWLLGVNYPASNAYQPLYQSLKISVFLVFLAILSSFFITRAAMAGMLAPLNALTASIQQYDPGQKYSSLPQMAASNDEVGRLGRAYERMIAKISEQHVALHNNSVFIENLVNYSATPSFVIDKDHHILFWNLALAKLTGLSSEEMRGTDRHWEAFYSEKRPTMADLVLGQAENNVSDFYENFRISGLIDGAMESEGWFRFPGMGRRFLVFHAAPITDGDGNIVAVVENLEDLTEAKQIENMLNEQYRHLQQLLDSIPNPVFNKNRNGAFIGCNRAFEVFYNLKRTEIMGRKFTDLTADKSASFQGDQDMVCMKNDLPLSYEIAIVQADGVMRQVIVTKAPTHDRNGKVNGLVGTYTDITERKQIETALRESEEKFRTISNSAQDAIIMIDNDGRVTFWNNAAEKIFGFSRREIMGQDLHEIIAPPAMVDRYRAAFSNFREDGSGEMIGKTLEVPAIRKDGSEIPIEVSLASVLLGGKWCAICLARDITARKEAQEAIVASKAAMEAKHAELSLIFNWVESAKLEWEQTLDSLKDIIIILANADHTIRRCNRMLLDITGQDYDALVQKDWRKVFSDSGFTFVTFDGKTGELLHTKSHHMYDLHIYEIHNPEDETPLGLVISMNDVTEIKLITRELEKAYAELQSTQTMVIQQEKMASIGQMAAGVAHEINNPMGFITSNLNSMNKYMARILEYQKALDEHMASCQSETKKELEEMKRRLKIDFILEDSGNLVNESLEGAERVRKIVQDLKSFSRVDEADEQLADLNQCLESTINIARNEIKYVATLTKDFGEIPQIKCYPQQLNQVFMNLLVNAAHAISDQGKITVRSWSDTGNVFISVSDTGSGIPEEIQQRIFEPFFTTKEAGKGTGLGLSISYDIIRKHGGEIMLESKVDQGTTFTIRLPIKTSQR